MAKNIGPCFEFVINRDNAKIEFAFLPGNISKSIFEEIKNEIVGAFKARYGVSSSDYVRNITLEDGTPSIAIYQSKVIPVLVIILEIKLFTNFKIKFTGVDKDGVEKTKIFNTSTEAKEGASELIPYFNKRNNELTTHRRK